MRIEPIHEANTNRQKNPYRIPCAVSQTTGKSASRVPFVDCLRTQYNIMRSMSQPFGQDDLKRYASMEPSLRGGSIQAAMLASSSLSDIRRSLLKIYDASGKPVH